MGSMGLLGVTREDAVAGAKVSDAEAAAILRTLAARYVQGVADLDDEERALAVSAGDYQVIEALQQGAEALETR